MVASRGTLDALENIGLNMYERKIYAALLSRGVSTAGELSEMTGVPRSRAYDVLESLADKGFVILKPSKPMEYVAIPPEEALENAKNLHRESLNRNIERIEEFKKSKALEELKSLYNEGVNLVDPADMSGSLKGRYSVYQQLGNMIRDAEKEIKILTTEKGLADLYESHFELLKDASEKGVVIRIIAPLTTSNRDAVNALKEFADIRDLNASRFKRVPKTRMSIIDGNKVTLALTHDNVHPTQDTAFWTSSTHAASEALDPYFDFLWENCSS